MRVVGASMALNVDCCDVE